MLGTGTTCNTTEQPEHATLERDKVRSATNNPTTFPSHCSSTGVVSRHFFPFMMGRQIIPPHPNTPYWMHRWANFTNKEVVMLGAGVQSGVYLTFKVFSYLEIKRFIGLYILQGLNPSPQVEMKFSSQASDPVQGNDLCFRMFGHDAVR